MQCTGNLRSGYALLVLPARPGPGVRPHQREHWLGHDMLDDMSLRNVAEELARAARELGSEDVEHTLDKAVALAVELLEDCDGAGVSLVRRDKSLQTPAATADWVARGDALQYELQDGPGIDAVWEHEMLHSPDLANDERWPSWGPRVVEDLGVRTILCIQLFTDDDKVGVLNLYSKQPYGFTEDSDRYEAQALAAHVAVALVAALEIQHLHAAVMSRTVIGQAEGILMERFDIDAARAFEVLKRISSRTNTKLHAVANEVVLTRRLPGSHGNGVTGDGPG